MRKARQREKRGGAILASMAALLLMAGCVSVESYEGVEAVGIEGKTWQADGADSGESVTEETSWWEQFGDPQLSALVERAVTNNRNLKQAQARLDAAYARRGIDAADRLPQVSAQAGATRMGVGEKGAAMGGPPAGTEVDFYSAGAVAGWELDLWGRVKRLTEAADADVGEAREAYRGAMVSVAAETALAYVELATANQRLENLDTAIALQDENLKLIEGLRAAGTARDIEVETARQGLQQAKARRPGLLQSATMAENALASLVGELPQEGLVGKDFALAMPDLIGLGVPADLIRMRPDVRQAERAYAAAVSRVGVAEAERYPKLSLSGSFKFQTIDLDNLIDEDAFVYSLGPAIDFPLFTGGKIKSGIAARKADAERAKWALEQSVIDAAREVENAATGVARSESRLRELQVAKGAAERIEDLVTTQNENGLASRIELIEAELAKVDLKDQLIASKQQSLSQVVSLFRALGGGWKSLESVSSSGEEQAKTIFEKGEK